MKDKIRVRFAPSPKEYLHIDNARTALFNWLLARKHGGSFILRIEDADIERPGDQFTDAIIEDLRWLGLEWDEGPNIGGEFGPYKQSLRTAIYKEYFEKIKTKGLVYPCYCTLEELEQQYQTKTASGKPPLYDKRCRNLSDTERTGYEEEGRHPSWRFKVSGEKVIVHDIVRGDISFDTGLIGDFIIIKQDGTPSFDFAVTIDDICMKITHIICSEKHLSNTPRHILLLQALGADTPLYVHNSPIVISDSTKLKTTSVLELRKSGYLPEGLINYMALLGWSSGNKRELYNKKTLIDTFTLTGLSTSPVMYDKTKLDRINSYHIRNTDLSRLINLIIPYLKDAKLIKGSISEKRFASLKKMIALIRDNLNTLDQSTENMKIFLSETIPVSDPDKLLDADYIVLLFQSIHRIFKETTELNAESVKDIFKKSQKALNLKGDKFYIPLKLALTGKMRGPDLTEVIPLIGKEKVLKRLEQVLDKSY